LAHKSNKKYQMKDAYTHAH